MERAGWKVTGYRVGPQPKDETEHFIKCSLCGSMLDMRDLGEILIHEEECARVQRRDNGECGSLTGDNFGDYTAVRWDDGTSTWIRRALLKLMPLVLS